MLPAPRLPFRRACAACAVLALALLAAAPARALEVELPAVRLGRDALWVDANLTDLFPERIEESLARGMPATLQLHAELWRRRSLWFDKFEAGFDAEIRIQYEVWERAYKVQRRGQPVMMIATLDSVAALLGGPLALRVADASRIDPEGRYYIAVEATLKPLRVEDVEQLEGWLSGEAEASGGGVGVITGLPRALFDSVRNVAGFGDQRARARTPEFEAGRLGR